MQLSTTRGDITVLDVDAVVNAANTRLARGAGVCGAIFAAAGPELDRACDAIGGCDTGDAVVTPGFEARARWIVHTPGPIWSGGDAGEAELLASCYRRSLERAVEVGARSIAFPAISTGIFGFPPDQAAAIAVRTVASFEPPPGASLVEAVLVAFDDETAARYAAALDAGT